MKKSELIKLLQQYSDEQEILVEAAGRGFDSPVVYITAVRGRMGKEFVDGSSSEYVDGAGAAGFGAVVLGTADGLRRLN